MWSIADPEAELAPVGQAHPRLATAVSEAAQPRPHALRLWPEGVDVGLADVDDLAAGAEREVRAVAAEPHPVQLAAAEADDLVVAQPYDPAALRGRRHGAEPGAEPADLWAERDHLREIELDRIALGEPQPRARHDL